MEWKVAEADITVTDSSDVEGLIARMESEFRHGEAPLEGFHFLNSPQQILEYSKDIEDELQRQPTVSTLYVRLHSGEKVYKEIKPYQRLYDTGTRMEIQDYWTV